MVRTGTIGVASGLAALLASATPAHAEEGARRSRSGPVVDYSGQDTGAGVHYYIDDEGRVHFTNRPELVPPRYQASPIELVVEAPGRG